MPIISVVIPTYNNLESFKRVFNSILAQKFEDYEVVITDDSSTDEIGEFLAQISDSRVKYFKNTPALGAPENWNEGIRKSVGKYIKIMHHDDWFATDKALGKFIDLMERNPQSDFGYSKSVNIEIESGKKTHRHAQKYVKMLEKNPLELLKGNRIGAPSVCVFKNGLGILFDNTFKWVVDVDFYIAVLLKNPKIAFIGEELINIGIQKDRLTDFCKSDMEFITNEKERLWVKYLQG